MVGWMSLNQDLLGLGLYFDITKKINGVLQLIVLIDKCWCESWWYVCKRFVTPTLDSLRVDSQASCGILNLKVCIGYESMLTLSIFLELKNFSINITLRGPLSNSYRFFKVFQHLYSHCFSSTDRAPSFLALINVATNNW